MNPHLIQKSMCSTNALWCCFQLLLYFNPNKGVLWSREQERRRRRKREREGVRREMERRERKSK